MRCLLMVSALLAGVGPPVVSGRASATILLMSQNTVPSAREKTTQGSDQVKTTSWRGEVAMPQPLGIVPTNAVTNRPYVSPEGGHEGYRQTVGALQRTLTELQQLTLQMVAGARLRTATPTDPNADFDIDDDRLTDLPSQA